ncbi:MAG: alpha-hydroxy-acid oxidizing protein [Acidobacteriia bacterium]|nr:alpha-hydroxy-acid oxidizing protein [Terriglobia bacterium]
MSRNHDLTPRPAPPLRPIPRPCRVIRSTRCMNCGTCIEACVYDCHERRADDPRRMADPKEACCRNCFACVFRCPRQALRLERNPVHAALGDATYTPEIVCSLQEQATEGKVPVSGAGYGGPFDGEGYDGIWTDMSEIVRPTRDGIHGREQIATTVTLGAALPDLCGMVFDAEGSLKSHIPPSREIPIPVVFGLLPFSPGSGAEEALALAASRLTTYASVRAEDRPERFTEHLNHLVVCMRPEELDARRSVLDWATIVEFLPGGGAVAAVARVREINPHVLTVVRVPAGAGAAREIVALADAGAETIHLAAGTDGRGEDGTALLSCLRESHLSLVERGLRDRLTLLASGGVAVAEHVPKAILLGADALVVDVPLLIAMGCTVCSDCGLARPCPLGLGGVDVRWGATRVINLMLAWRDQLLEVLGAMGLRDVRRLRGETGRAIFAADARRGFLERLGRGAAGTPAGAPGGSEAGPRRAAIAVAPHRFATALGPFRVAVDRGRCTDCGLCVASCRPGVHRRTEGKASLEEPRHERCLGPSCLENDWCCVRVCPWDAIEIEDDPTELSLGDRRWTAALLRETWRQARTGAPTPDAPSALSGGSGGGFDALSLETPPGVEPRSGPIDLSIDLNRRSEGPRLAIPIPIYGGGMSFGSVSLQVMMGRARAARRWGTFTSTGEGGYPPELAEYSDHVITQIATGLFGVREETIRLARLVEFKYAQGAKPGLGGHLLGEKNTPGVAAMREAVPGTALFSPFPFHSVYSVEDHKKHLDWIRAIHPEVLISVKVSTAADVDMVAVGSYYAGANVIHLDGAYGGTGAAPDIAKKNIAQPIEYAVAQAHDFLVSEGIRDEVALMASGGVRTAEDALKAIALGADGVVVGTAELVAIDCVRCCNCERGRGCPIGIATTDPSLAPQLTPDLVEARISNLYRAWADHFARRLGELGLSSVRALRGRRDLLAPSREEVRA